MTQLQQQQTTGQQPTQVWMAADYHFPSSYSCRIPMSSANCASVMPAPGPATVRLALLRVGIELFGLKMVREALFPLLRAATVRIRPPERVAVSQQLVRGYKWSEAKHKRGAIQESIIVREMAHAAGSMTVFLQMPEEAEQRMHRLLQAVPYWGQSSSLTSCLGVRSAPPLPAECALPLDLLDDTAPVRPYFSCPVTEFRSHQLSWEEVVPGGKMPKASALRCDIYVWPMVMDYRHGTQKGLVRAPRSAERAVSSC